MIRKKIRTYIKNNKKTTTFLLAKFIALHNYCYRKISEYAGYLNNDIHPKHDIIQYHAYYVDNVESSDVVLDLGCGNGFLAYDVAVKAQKIIGIDIKDYNIAHAKKTYVRDNLEFIVGDATEYQFNQTFDKILLSNVLEHIEHRVDFLKKLKSISHTIILRVPMINRSWLAVYKKQNGFDYRLDNTHFIEYTLESLQEELVASGWYLDTYQINWGELWGILRTKN